MISVFLEGLILSKFLQLLEAYLLGFFPKLLRILKSEMI